MKKKMISIVTTLALMTAGSIFADAAWVEPKTEISRGNTERETPMKNSRSTVI